MNNPTVGIRPAPGVLSCPRVRSTRIPVGRFARVARRHAGSGGGGRFVRRLRQVPLPRPPASPSSASSEGPAETSLPASLPGRRHWGLFTGPSGRSRGFGAIRNSPTHGNTHPIAPDRTSSRPKSNTPFFHPRGRVRSEEENASPAGRPGSASTARIPTRPAGFPQSASPVPDPGAALPPACPGPSKANQGKPRQAKPATVLGAKAPPTFPARRRPSQGAGPCMVAAVELRVSAGAHLRLGPMTPPAPSATAQGPRHSLTGDSVPCLFPVDKRRRFAVSFTHLGTAGRVPSSGRIRAVL